MKNKSVIVFQVIPSAEAVKQQLVVELIKTDFLVALVELLMVDLMIVHNQIE
jgi:hypothetical protein